MAPSLDTPSPPSPAEPTATPAPRSRRSPPFLPTPTECLVLAAFPAILVFGAIFALLSPQTRAAPYDHFAQAYVQDPALSPSYFARKSNLLNVLFVKRGWAWVTASFATFVAMHPSFAAPATAGGDGWAVPKRVQAAIRWALVTAWWFFVTQWCFGPPLIDRGFRLTGGRCVLAEGAMLFEDDPRLRTVATALACRAIGGRWSGGHDISGHVFLLVVGAGFLLQEIGWVWAGARGGEERRVVMPDGTTRGAVAAGGVGKEKEKDRETEAELGPGGNAVLVVVALSFLMLLFTAMFFHTWFEKFTGLITALAALYGIYVVPRFVPVLRGLVGLPGLPR